MWVSVSRTLLSWSPREVSILPLICTWGCLVRILDKFVNYPGSLSIWFVDEISYIYLQKVCFFFKIMNKWMWIACNYMIRLCNNAWQIWCLLLICKFNLLGLELVTVLIWIFIYLSVIRVGKRCIERKRLFCCWRVHVTCKWFIQEKGLPWSWDSFVVFIIQQKPIVLDMENFQNDGM